MNEKSVNGCRPIQICSIEENTVLKNWYLANGLLYTEIKKFEYLSFTSGYLERREGL